MEITKEIKKYKEFMKTKNINEIDVKHINMTRSSIIIETIEGRQISIENCMPIKNEERYFAINIEIKNLIGQKIEYIILERSIKYRLDDRYIDIGFLEIKGDKNTVIIESYNEYRSTDIGGVYVHIKVHDTSAHRKLFLS